MERFYGSDVLSALRFLVACECRKEAHEAVPVVIAVSLSDHRRIANVTRKHRRAVTISAELSIYGFGFLAAAGACFHHVGPFMLDLAFKIAEPTDES